MTRFLSREVYGEIDPIALERAAERGTAVHQATEQLDKTGTVTVSEEYSGYLDAYCKFRDEHDVKWGLIEHPVVGFNSALGNGPMYAGTIDRYGTVDGERCIVDIKTSKTISKKHMVMYSVAQTLYYMALDCEQPVDKLYILHLKPSGEYKLINLLFREPEAVSCILLHNALRAASPKKKKK